ncbi:hypothetical protein GCM10007377_14710 [Galliscardovia ingluviei]|uniref:Uncharacterized protein n=2 Tax=Galliscardovia ingluviei TaxID=1769422 RepID=A0A8J3EZR5_9BIFI|nr:hypothetical protein GCM10007377_14710 [Galliscardovia ingluviei]
MKQFKTMRNKCAPLYTAIICFAMIIAICIGGYYGKKKAYANDLLATTEQYISFVQRNNVPVRLGVMATSADGRNLYCIEAGEQEELQYTATEKLADNVDNQRIAWLISHYKQYKDAKTHAAIAYLAHEHLDADTKHLWTIWKPWIAEQYPDVAPLAQQLWQESEGHIAQSAKAQVQYSKAIRQGNINIQVSNSQQQQVAGIPFEVVLQGPAAFDSNNEQKIRGITQQQPEKISWHATGTGKVKAVVRYAHGTLERLVSTQDYVRFAEYSYGDGEGVDFEVDARFQPQLTSQAVPHVLTPGETVSDTVTVRIGKNEVWHNHIGVLAQGYYYTGLTTEQLQSPIQPTAQEQPSQFIKRLKTLGYVPTAYASAHFTRDGQQIHVIAKQDFQAQSKTYRATERDGIGTWVWVIDKAKQDKDVASWLQGNYISTFIEKTESTSTRQPLKIDSTVTEHTAHIGSSISDTITVQGFPKDHGKFRGDTQAGFSADLEYMTVELYWAGDHNNSARNEEYKPSTTEIPGLDEHHTLVGQWQYRAVNGTIRVGNGSKDIHGKPVNIEANEPGYYVFVLDFEGDSRVMPAQSEYNNAWERVWVPPTPSPTTEPITMTTAVNADRAAPGDTVFDTARIRGSLPKGAYITFSAYEVPESISSAASTDEDDSDDGGSIRSNINTAWKVLLDEYRVELPENSNTLMETSKQNNGKFSEDERATSESIYAQDGTLYVSSKHIQVAKSGKVYWKATLWSAGGDVLASHPLGIKGEVTTVEEPPSPPQTPPEEPHELAQTGAHTVTLIGVGVVMALIGLVGMSVLRVNGYRHSREQ